MNRVFNILPRFSFYWSRACCMRAIALCGAAICSQDGATALMCAAAEGHTDCARLLIDAGADKEAKNKVCR
jgi:hypothetical protein